MRTAAAAMTTLTSSVISIPPAPMKCFSQTKILSSSRKRARSSGGKKGKNATCSSM